MQLMQEVEEPEQPEQLGSQSMQLPVAVRVLAGQEGTQVPL